MCYTFTSSLLAHRLLDKHKYETGTYGKKYWKCVESQEDIAQQNSVALGSEKHFFAISPSGGDFGRPTAGDALHSQMSSSPSSNLSLKFDYGFQTEIILVPSGKGLAHPKWLVTGLLPG